MDFDDLTNPPIEAHVAIVLEDMLDFLGYLRICDAALARANAEMAALNVRLKAGTIEVPAAHTERQRIEAYVVAAFAHLEAQHPDED